MFKINELLEDISFFETCWRCGGYKNAKLTCDICDGDGKILTPLGKQIQELFTYLMNKNLKGKQ